MKITILGAPGAGKGTQAKRIAKECNIPHISTGDILRTNINNETKLGKQAKGYIEQGLLVPDELVCNLVIDRITEKDCTDGYILDGFPRTIPQAEYLDTQLRERKDALDYAIEIRVSDEDIIQRMGGRRACSSCGATYHITYKAPQREGICDICNKTLVTREDDIPATVQKRLDVYHTQTRPLLAYYQETGILQTVEGTHAMEAVFQAILTILGV